ARLERQHRHARGQLGRVEALPQAAAQALGRHQVQLGVQPGEPLAGRGDVVAVQVAELVEDPADPVEGPRDHVTAPRDLALKVVDFLLLAEVALGVPGVLLPVGAGVARVPAQLAAQLGDVPVAGEAAWRELVAAAPVTPAAGPVVASPVVASPVVASPVVASPAVALVTG